MTAPWTPSTREGEEVTLSQAVHEAVGSASMCWEHVEHAGVFDTTRALWVADGLQRWLLDNVMNRPWLGNATTAELIAELFARCATGSIDGNYKTVSE